MCQEWHVMALSLVPSLMGLIGRGHPFLLSVLAQHLVLFYFCYFVFPCEAARGFSTKQSATSSMSQKMCKLVRGRVCVFCTCSADSTVTFSGRNSLLSAAAAAAAGTTGNWLLTWSFLLATHVSNTRYVNETPSLCSTEDGLTLNLKASISL